MNDKFSGEQLRIARIFSGLALQDLAGKIGNVSKQYIQQLEKNVKVPSEDMVNALSEALDVEREFFYKNRQTFITEDQCHFRKLTSTPAFVRDQALIHGELLTDFIKYVETKINLPKNNFLKKEITSFNNIEKISEECRELWGLGKNAPIQNMVRVLENAGAIISYFKGVSDKVDAFSFELERPVIIRNEAKDSVCRLRFDLAHECGHIVMHECVRTGDIETENQANQFASSFLLPKNAFLNEFNFLADSRIQWKILFERKKRWKVSLAAIFRRAHDLGIMSSIQYRNANIALRKNGWAKNEPMDNEIEKEVPVLIKKSLEIFENKGTGIQECLNHLKVKKHFLQKLTGFNIEDTPNNVVFLFK